jgi:hypothetical protein
MLLCPHGFCPAKQVKPRATFFCPKIAQGFASAKSLMPLPTLKPYLFYLLSPEAVWLTAEEQDQTF